MVDREQHCAALDIQIDREPSSSYHQRLLLALKAYCDTHNQFENDARHPHDVSKRKRWLKALISEDTVDEIAAATSAVDVAIEREILGMG